MHPSADQFRAHDLHTDRRIEFDANGSQTGEKMSCNRAHAPWGYLTDVHVPSSQEHGLELARILTAPLLTGDFKRSHAHCLEALRH